MAHHQHHGAEYEAQVSRSLQSRPSSTTLPSISEDEQVADADEPPDHKAQQPFTKAMPARLPRRQSLLTKAFHTDSESHGEEDYSLPLTIGREHSLSSTCSNYSARSVGDFTSDDGVASNGTRASTPCSPRSMAAMMNPALGSFKASNLPVTKPRSESAASKTSSIASGAAEQSEPNVEAELGRKRCISFACGASRKDSTPATPKPAVEVVKAPEPQKRPCALKFFCPGRTSAEKPEKAKIGPPSRTARHLSPAPFADQSPSPRRTHRDSDTTIKNESPKATRHTRRFSEQRDPARSEATRFHEFASSDEEVEEWCEESTAYRTRLTVNDTLKKENDIRKLAEEAEEEDALEEDEDDVFEDEEGSDGGYSSDDEESDTGFHTDDEIGFADSDDESDGDSDYEWWVPRKTLAASPFVNPQPFKNSGLQRTGSNSSSNSHGDSGSWSPRKRGSRLVQKPSRPVDIRADSSDLPDSTDFVCGTLDEDRPLEQAFASQLHQKRAAKHRVIPQDIDPTFPTSDPEVDSDNNEEDDDDEQHLDNRVEESDQNMFLPGRFEHQSEDNSVPRGRQPSAVQRKSPRPSPLRLRSPQMQNKRCTRNRSPAPAGMCNNVSPRRVRSPAPGPSMDSPAPKHSRSESSNTKPAFLEHQDHEPEYTASLPRSPGPMGRRKPSIATIRSIHHSEDEEDDEATANEKTYHRGAIDIVQGLENKRLRRRQKFYERYCKKEERKERKHSKKPLPGKGAERMRQVGIECAEYRGKRVLSI